MSQAGILKFKKPELIAVAYIALLYFFTSNVALGDNQNDAESAGESEAQIIQKFTSQESIDSEIVTIDDKRKRQIMFAMGVPLLLFIIITVSLGVAMGVFGKDVYIAHMVFAGLSLTLALGHAIVGLVWFWPF